MKTGIAISILAIISFSCTIDNSNNNPVARIDSTIIYQYEIDSLVNRHMHSINLSALYQLIDDKVITLNSNKYNIKENGILSPCSTIIPNSEDPLNSSKKLNSNNNYKDSLLMLIKNEHDIRIFLTHESFDHNILEKLYGYSINNSNEKKTIFVLFDYCCTLCAIEDRSLRKMSKELNVNLKYIYYSDCISIEALACDVAKKYGKYWQMHDSIISRTCLNDLDSTMQVANSIGIDTSVFQKLIFDKKNIEKHEKNRNILDKMNLYGVPTYIYNNTIYNDIESIKFILQAEN